jgi:hypothetical protein
MAKINNSQLDNLPQSKITNLTTDLAAKASASSLSTHISDTANPHVVTKAQVGLSAVPNTDFTSAVAANTAKTSFDSTSSAKLAGIETGATANSSDATLLARANHTGTQVASTISDFDTEVSNNTDVSANTSARHAAVTVTDSTEIDFTLTGQDLTAALKLASIDETKLDTSVNASLDLADSATQPGDLATVATSGAYSDLTGTPTIPTSVDELNPSQTGNSGKVLQTDGTNATWQTAGGGGSGDMLAATYDPTSVAGDAFDQDNMADGTTNKNYTATEQTKLTGIETAADVTDTTNVTAAGALMDSELASIADVKALNQSVVSAATPNFGIANMTLDDTNLIVVPVTNLQDFADGIDHSVLKARSTGVTTSYVSTVALGGTTFAQPDVIGEINGDEGYFDVHYTGATGISVTNLTAHSTYVYIDKNNALQQQTTAPTREDWSRKMFTMRIAVNPTTSQIISFEYLNNPIGHYANSIRDLYTYLLAQGVPFKIGQLVTGRTDNLGFDVGSGSLMEFGGTGDIYNPNVRAFSAVANASYYLLSRTGTVGSNTNLVKSWDNNGVITALGSTTLVGHRLYRFSSGNFAMQYGQGNYANIVLAKAGVLLEDYVLNPDLEDATFMGWWLIEDIATNTGNTGATTTTAFIEYTIGIQGGSSSSLSGALLKGNNLSDLLNVATTRANLGLDTTANQTDSLDKRFMTDAQETVLNNTSESNSGDNATNTQYSGLVTNATHTGDATGATALTLSSAAITGKTEVTAAGTDYVLISDTSDSGNLKKVLASTLGGSGDVVGPSSSTDGAIALYDLTTGKLLKESAVGITTNGAIKLPLVASPIAADTDEINVFGRKIAGRMLPAFMSPSGLDSALQPLIARNKIAWANPIGNSTALTLMGIALTAVGTATAANVSVTNVHTTQRRIEYAVTTAATTAIAGWRDATAKYFLGNGFGGFTYVCRFGPSRGFAANTNRRFFNGFVSSIAAPTNVNPSTIADCLGVGADTADTTWQFMHRTGTGTVVKVSTGIPKSAADATEAYELAMFTAPDSGLVSMEFTRMSTGTVAKYTASTSVPASTTLLAPTCWTSVGATSSVVGISLISLYIETDY